MTASRSAQLLYTYISGDFRDLSEYSVPSSVAILDFC